MCKLFLWGSTCGAIRREQDLLRARGLEVITLADLGVHDHGRSSPQQIKQLRAAEIMTCAAVVVDSELPIMERKRCIAVCEEIGVRCVDARVLDADAMRGNEDEFLDAHDLTYRRDLVHATTDDRPTTCTRIGDAVGMHAFREYVTPHLSHPTAFHVRKN